MKTAICVLVVLVSLLHYGAAIKCYIGAEDSTTTMDCSGSCVKSTVSAGSTSGSVYSCSPVRSEEGCSEATLGVKAEQCICNTDYCNTATATAALSLPLLLLSYILQRFI